VATERLESIDVARGLTVRAMLLVSDLAGVGDVPAGTLKL